MKGIVLSFFSWFYISLAIGQKPALDTSLSLGFYQWPAIFNPAISNDGKFVLYMIRNMPITDSTILVVKSVDQQWEREFSSVERASMTSDCRHIVLKRKGGSISLVSLGSDEENVIPDVESYLLSGPENKEEWLAYIKNNGYRKLIVRSLKSTKELEFDDVEKYAFNKQGTVLLFQSKDKGDKAAKTILHWLDLITGKDIIIWRGDKCLAYSFDSSGRQLAFIADLNETSISGRQLWWYESGKDSSIMQANGMTFGIDSNLCIDEITPSFSLDGRRIFFQLIEKPIPRPSSNAVKVDVWNYKDLALQSLQVTNAFSRKSFSAVIPINSNRVIRLQLQNERILISHVGEGKYAIIVTEIDVWSDSWWKPESSANVYIESTIDGTRKLLCKNIKYRVIPELYKFSPDEKWIVYFDKFAKGWFSYNIDQGASYNISCNMPYSVSDENYREYPTSLYNYFQQPVGLGGWRRQDTSVIIYDDYDIWQVNLANKRKPINITMGYGRKNRIKFRIAQDRNTADIFSEDTLLISAFSTLTKFNGLYKKAFLSLSPPELLAMGPYVLCTTGSQLFRYSSAISPALIKARNSEAWMVFRRSTKEAPNLFLTRDFKTFSQISNLEPQRRFNWLTAELIHWKSLDKSLLSGILYKPENFNSKKKYPVIVTYYEQQSDNLYDYPIPEFSVGDINIPYFVSNEYLVFVPDIHYQIGYPGRSALNSVVSGVRYLSKLNFVDSKHMAIAGHSFGGFETNYILTHTSLFAAAVEASGPSDYISFYDGLMYNINGEGASAQFHAELDQSRIGATLWQRPDLYRENSPVLRANLVTTPLLMMHNREDGIVQFSQGVELFNALRRSGKKVWLLQYDGEGHLVFGKNAFDYTVRLSQFFGYYLKMNLPPVWMTTGVPARLKGFITGYELDSTGKRP